MHEQDILLEQHTLDFVQHIEELNDPNAVAASFQNYIVQLGLQNVCCMKVPERGESIADQVLMSTSPTEWIARYVDRNYVERDPMVLEMFRTYQPYAWSDVLARRDISRDDKTIVFEASEFKMNVGFIVPIFGDTGYAGLASVSGETAELTNPTRAALQLSCLYVHNKLLALRRRKETKLVQLTPRENECMRWAASGKSDWDIGEILGISEKTVNFHLENAKRKYGVATRVQAVVAAIRQGILLPY